MVSSLIWVVLDETLAVAGEIVCKEAKGPFIEGECLVVQREFRGRISDSRSNSGTGVVARQPEITLLALL